MKKQIYDLGFSLLVGLVVAFGYVKYLSSDVTDFFNIFIGMIILSLMIGLIIRMRKKKQ